MELDLFEQNFNIINENNNETCAICYENLNIKSCYTINECKHIFHSNCLLDWFRNSNKSSCPYCRNIIEMKNNQKNSLLFNLKIKFSKTKKAPKKFVQLIKKYKNIENEFRDIEKKYKELWNKERKFNKNIDVNKTYNEIKKEKLEIRKQVRNMFSKRNKLRSKYFIFRNAIESIPIKPIFVKTKKICY